MMECEDELLEKNGECVERCIYENVLGMLHIDSHRRIDMPGNPADDTPLKRVCAMLK